MSKTLILPLLSLIQDTQTEIGRKQFNRNHLITFLTELNGLIDLKRCKSCVLAIFSYSKVSKTLILPLFSSLQYTKTEIGRKQFNRNHLITYLTELIHLIHLKKA